MHPEYWQKQTTDKPLFPDLLWSQPENKRLAGKLLIVGGNQYGFAAAGEAYQAATKAGIGTTRVLLPDVLEKTVRKYFEAAEFAPSTRSGGFGQQALGEFIASAQWADSVLLAGDFGHNSETAIVLENLLQKYSGPLLLVQDVIETFTTNPVVVMNRPKTIVVVTLPQLQQLAKGLHSELAFTSTLGLLRLIELLHEFTMTYPINLILVNHLNNILVAVNGQVSSTTQPESTSSSVVSLAAQSAVWLAQNPTRPFEALTTAVAA